MFIELLRTQNNLNNINLVNKINIDRFLISSKISMKQPNEKYKITKPYYSFAKSLAEKKPKFYK